MPPKALIFFGGWDLHQPEQVAQVFERICSELGMSVELSSSLAVLADLPKLQTFRVIIPCWTMGTITPEQQAGVCAAVRGGLGMAGCHGGMCDAFRDATDWQFMTGGQWVAHPGDDGLEYTVRISNLRHEITAGIGDFVVRTEQYYMHVDPANQVLATTRFPIADGPHVPNGEVEMPVLWTKYYGRGRVFYSALGHSAAVVSAEPHRTLLKRGVKWAAEG